MRKVLLFAGICAALWGGGACGPLRYKGADPDAERRAAADWPFWPVVMRVHPFTSLAAEREGGGAMLEARMELLDPAGDVTKGVGRFRFELYAAQPTESREGEQQRLYVWDAPIHTLEENREHYDPITRTYHFNLKLDEPPPTGQRLRLLVQFDGPQPPRLEAEAEVELRTPEPAAP